MTATITSFMESQTEFVQCGLNADWCVTSYHLGPSGEPNKNSGDMYLVDNEDGTWSIMQVVYPTDDPQDRTTVEGLCIGDQDVAMLHNVVIKNIKQLKRIFS